MFCVLEQMHTKWPRGPGGILPGHEIVGWNFVLIDLSMAKGVDITSGMLWEWLIHCITVPENVYHGVGLLNYIKALFLCFGSEVIIQRGLFIVCLFCTRS